MDADQLPLTVLVPENAQTPVEVCDQHAALKIAVVEREGVKYLSKEWEVPGVYLLVEQYDGIGWGVYVGKAAGVRARILEHVNKKPPWYRAVLVRRDTTHGFNSAHVGWLEGRLYDMLATAERVVLRNANRPGDETLAPYDRQMLEQVVLPVQRVLRLIGHDPSPPDDKPITAQSKSWYGISLERVVQAGLVKAGANLVSTNGAWPATARVTADGRIEVSGKRYSSPSKAAAAVKGGTANGWDFWAVQSPTGPEKLALFRARYMEAESAKSSG